METSSKAGSIFQEIQGWWFGTDSKHGGGEECADSGHILKVEPRGFRAELNVVHKKKKGVKDDSNVFSLSNGKDGTGNSAMWEEQVFGQSTGLLFWIC